MISVLIYSAKHNRYEGEPMELPDMPRIDEEIVLVEGHREIVRHVRWAKSEPPHIEVDCMKGPEGARI
jgi:hypothetical protein